MPSVEARTAAFYSWETEGRGRRTYPHPVPLEPVFRPFPGHIDAAAAPIDDARKPTWLSSLVESESKAGRKDQRPIPESASPPPFERRGALREFEILVPVDEKIDLAASAMWLRSVSAQGGPISFELVAEGGMVAMHVAAVERDALRLRDQTLGFFPNTVVRRATRPLARLWNECTGVVVAAGEFVLAREFMLPLDAPAAKSDLLTPMLAALGRMGEGEVAIVQVLFEPVQAPWGPHAVAAVTTPYGEPFFADAPEITKLAHEKCAEPLWAAVVRCIARTGKRDAAEDVLLGVTAALGACGSPGRNELEGVRPADFDRLIEDLLDRRTHRSGMILSLSDLCSIVHLPSPAVRAECLVRPSTRTKAAPQLAIDEEFILGINEHDGAEREVGLSTDQRLRHCYVIGASGTGKSTLLLSLIAQDIAAGNGFGVLDPHGDLIDAVLARIPEDRAGDVVLFDPADEEYPVGFNILSAHSELERTLLSSDLVAVFRRLSTSFGDQMATVLGNAILAFLESTEGGTLIDLRHFLLDKAFRARFLETVRDEEIVAYWQQEFPLLKGLPYASILTRLNTFFRPKVLRYMVAQKNDRLDVRAIMDGRKILLAKLSQGAIGEENSHLLGSLLVAKIAQAAMSRQDEDATSRVPFFLYADEFHHFVTPSVASILSGARKYALGLTLAHQESRQLKTRSEDVASAVLANAFTRVVFRVGEQDAKAFADGFSFFGSADLQNLSVGEAVARIERQDRDFNLRTLSVAGVEEGLAGRRRAAIVAASRAGYGTPRAEIEAVLRADQAGRAGAPSAEAGKPSRKARGAMGTRAADVRPERSDSFEPTLPGRGGPHHKYLQSLVKRLAEDRGFKVSVEKMVLDGHGHVDVALERSGLSVGIEISVTTRAEQEVENMSKCLAAGFDYAVLLSSDERTLAQARSRLVDVDKRKVRFVVPGDLIALLDELPVPAPDVTQRKRGTHTRPRKDQPANTATTFDPAKRTMLIAKDAAAHLGLAQQTLAKMRWSGESPPYYKIGRQVVYDRAELDAWLSERRRRSTSDSGPS